MDALTLTRDPVWPWSASSFGLPALAIVTVVLVVLTVWTYLGLPGSSVRRVMIMLGLRLGALAMACLVILRPSVAYRDDLRVPSTLLVAVDYSESMTIQDEAGPLSRWDSLLRTLEKCKPILERLKERQNITVVAYRFAGELLPGEAGTIVPPGKADGKRTDYGKMLHGIYENHGQDRHLRGLVVIGDGADNGASFPPSTEALRLNTVPCPVHTFGLGRTTTADRQRDIAFTAINPQPSPVPVKGKLTVKGTLDAPGFENASVTVRLFIGNEEVASKKEILRKTTDNEVTLSTDAPDTPGEVKVTLKVDPLPGEMIPDSNNEISTYVSVIKEGISVLFVDRMRFPEPQRICDALSAYPNVRLFMAWRRTDEPALADADLFQFDKHHYDVIILGDLSPQRLVAGNPKVLADIQKQVRDKGTGLMMMGGYQALGNSDWKGTPIEELLPVSLNVGGQVDAKLQMEPTEKGENEYIMRLENKPEANRALWKKLPKLDGMTRLGQVKPGAIELARTPNKEPVLVGLNFGKYRTLAFAGDTTWRWQRLGQPRTSEGIDAHARFWKQVVYWLAKQDKGEGNIQVKPDRRRIASGGKLDFSIEMYGKDGEKVPEDRSPRYEVTVVDPGKVESPVPTAREDGNVRGHVWQSTGTPGEYRLVVKGWYKDAAGKEISGGDSAEAHFLVYEDNTELMRRAADHDFLTRLAKAGGGKFHMADELPRFLQELEKQPLPQNTPKADLRPDWRTSKLSGFLFSFFVVFVSLLCVEWFLRRHWGMV